MPRAPKRRAERGTEAKASRRARRTTDDDVIDVEAEPVADAPPRPAPPPIVVTVKATKPPAPVKGELCAGTARAFGFEAVARDIDEAAALGEKLGDLLATVFFGRRRR